MSSYRAVLFSKGLWPSGNALVCGWQVAVGEVGAV